MCSQWPAPQLLLLLRIRPVRMHIARCGLRCRKIAEVDNDKICSRTSDHVSCEERLPYARASYKNYEAMKDESF